MYSLSDHGAMIADETRMNAYLRALEKVITPDSCVVDIGAGSGVFALMAAKLGARRVYAIEPDDIIGLARRMVRDNQLSERVTLIQADAREVTLEERADVIVSDIGGHLPWHQFHLPVINHARSHFLAPDGRMIPATDRIFAAVVAAKDVSNRSVWHEGRHGIDLSAAALPASNEFGAHRFDPDDLLSDPVPVATLDYFAPLETDLDQRLDFHITRNGKAFGVALWFDRDLGDGICIENGPAAQASQNSRRIYSQLLFPWPEDVDLAFADIVRVSLRATLSDQDYDWSWDSMIQKVGGGKIQGIRYRQSSASPLPANGADLFQGKLSQQGTALRLCLQLMQRNASNLEIAETLMRSFPQRFPRRDIALAHVAALCREYT